MTARRCQLLADSAAIKRISSSWRAEARVSRTSRTGRRLPRGGIGRRMGDGLWMMRKRREVRSEKAEVEPLTRPSSHWRGRGRFSLWAGLLRMTATNLERLKKKLAKTPGGPTETNPESVPRISKRNQVFRNEILFPLDGLFISLRRAESRPNLHEFGFETLDPGAAP